jgi:isoleucyl-tRNA synthetase
MPKVEGRPESVHLAEFDDPSRLAPDDTFDLISDWKQLLAFRDQVLLRLEQLRKDKVIGKALEAKIVLGAQDDTLALLQRASASLKELFNVSQVVVGKGGGGIAITVAVEAAEGIKCERCWNYRTDTAPYGPWPVVCGRCANALDEMGYGDLNMGGAR